MRDMRLRVAKLILRGVASSTIAQAEGYPSYTARELSSYFSYSSISISSKPEPELLQANFKPRVAPRANEKKIFVSRGFVRHHQSNRSNTTEMVVSAQTNCGQGKTPLNTVHIIIFSLQTNTYSA